MRVWAKFPAIDAREQDGPIQAMVDLGKGLSSSIHAWPKVGVGFCPIVVIRGIVLGNAAKVKDVV